MRSLLIVERSIIGVIMNFLKITIVLVILCLSACQRSADLRPDLTSEEIAYIKNNPVITYGLLEDHPPISFSIDGVPAGIANDYFNLIAEKTGFVFALKKRGQVPELIEAIKECKVQALPGFRVTPDRIVFMGFSDPFVSIGTNIIVHPGIKVITKEMKVGAPRGYAVLDFLKPDSNDITTFQNNAEVVQALIDNRIDAAIMTQASAVYELDKLKTPQVLHTIPVPWTHYFSVGLCKNDEMLISIFNKALQTITKAERKAIDAKWHIDEVK